MSRFQLLLDVWTWHHRLAVKRTWDTIVRALIAQADAEGLVDWSVLVDSTIARAHQHATPTTAPAVSSTSGHSFSLGG